MVGVFSLLLITYQNFDALISRCTNYHSFIVLVITVWGCGISELHSLTQQTTFQL
jgi:hypothetical protein